jgi:hypothetical protein
VPAAFCFARAVLIRAVILALVLWAGSVRAQDVIVIPAEELGRPPSTARISMLVDRAAGQGWGSVTPVLRAAALQAYEGNTGYAPAWYYLYRWAALLGQPESRAIPQWIKAVEQAKVGHANMARSYLPKPGSLAAYWTRDLQIYALGSPQFSEEFFVTLDPVDNPMNLLSILQQLYAADPGAFAGYQNLAIALAVVYDLPPPPHWPHGQVSAKALPRLMLKPTEAFSYWVRADRENRTLHKLRRLTALELKFVVDTGAPVSEMTWARLNVTQPLEQFAKVYDLIKYRKDRLQANQFLWLKPTYQLSLILQEGGICVDQAYFACMVGKARGVPTLLFRGAGLDGRHAWFGYLDGQQRWQLDAGRYAEQKYVVGLALDPQTWRDINDYELLFMSERFRALPTYKLSVMHAQFAAEYLRDGKPALALKAAREAVNRERRNIAAWNALLEAQSKSSPDLRGVEGVLREAVLAFQKYPDLEVAFARQLVATLRARGETSAANFEESQLAKKYRSGRVDLSIQQAAAIMERSMKDDDLATQIRYYQQVLQTHGQNAGIDFYDKVVLVFARHLEAQKQVPAAISCVERAGQFLRVEKGSQLEQELQELLTSLKSGKK